MRGITGLLALAVLLPAGATVAAAFTLVWTLTGIGFWLDARARRREDTDAVAPTSTHAAVDPEPLDRTMLQDGLTAAIGVGPDTLAPMDAAVALPNPWRGRIGPRNNLLRDFLAVPRGAFLAVFVAWMGWAWQLLLRHLIRPDLVFVVYPGTRKQVRLYASPALAFLAPDVVPLGAIRRDPAWGVYATLKDVVTEHTDNPERVGQLLDAVRAAFPAATSVALAGRFPSVAHRAGRPVDAPFVDGVLGTIYAMERAIAALAAQSDRPPGDLEVCVLGGGGFVGRALLPLLQDTYRRVIAIDPRFVEGGGEQERILLTHRASDVGLADVVLVLTGRGDDAWMYVPYARTGQIWGDDTHPEMTTPVRRALVARGVDLWKVSVGDERLHLWPRLSTMPARATPGCMLMAAVRNHHGPEALADVASFSQAAEHMGFAPCLDRHCADEANDDALAHLPAELDEALVTAFQRLDRDGDGRVSPDEFLGELEDRLSRQDVEALVHFADIDGDGQVDYREFVRALAVIGDGEQDSVYGGVPRAHA